MSKESVAVRIAGHNYKILSDGDADLLRKIASYVDQAMGQVRKRTGTVDTLDVAVLTCLNLAREVLALRDQQNGAVEDDRMRSLIERVETILGREILSATEDADASRAADVDTSRAHSTGDAQAGPERGESARTLDLSSVEARRDRASASAEASEADSADASMPEARVAVGGRERAS
jgi:cell division protein ZapA (FtsZ GTPase activity inhibitor)